MERELYRPRSGTATYGESIEEGIATSEPAQFEIAKKLRIEPGGVRAYLPPADAAFVKSAGISCNRLRKDSPTLVKTSLQAARSFSSADAESPETTSRD